MYFALDIGGSYTKFAVIDNETIIKKGKWRTEDDIGYLLENVSKHICSDVKYIGISTGGFWQDEKAIAYETLESTKDGKFIKILKETYNCPVKIDNDAHCALLCEKEWGVLKNAHNAVMFVLGSSIGCSVLINGKLFKGATGQAASMFKMPEQVDSDNYICDETINSIKFTKKFDENAGRSNMLLIEEKSTLGDKKATEFLNKYSKTVALDCWYAYLMYDPSCIVLGGGIANSDCILRKVKFYLDEFFVLDKSTRKPNLLKTAFGEESNLLGATLL